MARVDAFNKGRMNKDDEFYTRLVDIENELHYYKDYFAGKTVFCNCDDPYESNFFKYFAMNFNYLGLKKLITTCYATSPVMYTQLTLFGEEEQLEEKGEGRKPYKVEITSVEDANGDGAVDLDDIEILLNKNKPELLKGDGDFRSDECMALFHEADVVVTNPPFSLFREFIEQLIKYEKDFLIIGRETAVSYKEVFPLFKDNKVWYGYTHAKEFMRPNGETQSFGNVTWFTNIEVQKRHEKLILYKKYNPNHYLSYENFDGIDVPTITEIPCDYDGIMGVPSSFMFYHNPEQFELIGYGKGELAKSVGVTKNYRGRTDLAVFSNGKHSCPFSRILIRRRNNGD